MAQIVYIHPDGSRGQQKGFAMPKRLTIEKVWSAARKALVKDMGTTTVAYANYTVDVDYIHFWLDGGAAIVIDRKANGLGR